MFIDFFSWLVLLVTRRVCAVLFAIVFVVKLYLSIPIIVCRKNKNIGQTKPVDRQFDLIFFRKFNRYFQRFVRAITFLWTRLCSCSLVFAWCLFSWYRSVWAFAAARWPDHSFSSVSCWSARVCCPRTYCTWRCTTAVRPPDCWPWHLQDHSKVYVQRSRENVLCRSRQWRSEPTET